MIHHKVLKKTGTTPERIREFFTATSGEDFVKAQKIRKRVSSRWQDGFFDCVKNARLYQAVDIAYEGTPIQKQTIPLMLWAQGKINMEALSTALSESEIAKKACEGSKKEGTLKVDIPRLYEISVNLVRSYVQRRHATQTSRFSNIWPHYRYEPRGNDAVSKLRGEVLSQRIDAMSDQYGYRHFDAQCYLHMFLYSRATAFPRSAWDMETGWRPKDLNIETDDVELESYIVREGLDFIAPHPSRTYFDKSSPRAQVNTDTGPDFLGYWDIVPFRDIKDQPDYFNTQGVAMSDAFSSIVQTQAAFFQYYYNNDMLKTMSIGMDRRESVDPLASNCRSLNIGLYADQERDAAVFITQHFERINPYHAGISNLNQEIWFRFVIAGDATIIGCEAMPSIPAVYGGVNENDDRDVSNSMAMEILPLQDQMQNLWSQMLFNLRTSLAQIWAIDTDAVDKDVADYIEKCIRSGEIYVEPKVFKYSGSALRDNGIGGPTDRGREAIRIIQADVRQTIDNSFNAITRLMALADRLLVLSPNELGQPNPREVAAREVVEISTSTNAIASSISDGIDEFRAAKKRLLFESLVCRSTHTFRVPSMNRYLKATIEKAGFSVEAAEDDTDLQVPIDATIIGKPSNLIYEYYFDSRDGAERPVNSQGAQVLMQLLVGFLQIEELRKQMGPKRIFEMANEISRLSGAAFDLKLDLEDGEKDETAATNDQLSERITQLEQVLMQLAGGGQPQQPPGPSAAGSVAPERSLPSALTPDDAIVASAGG